MTNPGRKDVQNIAKPASSQTLRLAEAIELESEALKLRVDAYQLDAGAANILAKIDRLRTQHQQMAKQIAQKKRSAGVLEAKAKEHRGQGTEDSLPSTEQGEDPKSF